MYRMYGMTQGAMEGGAVMCRMYGMTQGAMEGGAVMYRMCGQIFAPAISAYPPSLAVYDAVPWKDNCSCIIFISHIPVSKGKEQRISQVSLNVISPAGRDDM